MKDPSGVAEQKQMEQNSFHRMVEAYLTFCEIQKGPNPLTKDDVRKLIARRPEVWGSFSFLRKFAE